MGGGGAAPVEVPKHVPPIAPPPSDVEDGETRSSLQIDPSVGRRKSCAWAGRVSNGCRLAAWRLSLRHTQSGIIMALGSMAEGRRSGSCILSLCVVSAAPLLRTVWWYNHASRPPWCGPPRG